MQVAMKGLMASRPIGIPLGESAVSLIVNRLLCGCTRFSFRNFTDSLAAAGGLVSQQSYPGPQSE